MLTCGFLPLTCRIPFRYVFNTLENHKLGKDFGVPDIVSRSVLKPAAVGEDATTKSGVFEWILGPAGSGSHPHCHSGAWNAVVYGEKRWIAWPPGMLNERAVNLTMPAIEFFTDVVPGLVSEGAGTSIVLVLGSIREQWWWRSVPSCRYEG